MPGTPKPESESAMTTTTSSQNVDQERSLRLASLEADEVLRSMSTTTPEYGEAFAMAEAAWLAWWTAAQALPTTTHNARSPR